MYGSPTCNAYSRQPRLLGWLIAAILLLALLGIVAPDQVPVVVYKALLLILAVVMAYWIERALFPYARPHECLARAGRLDASEAALYRSELRFAAACLRRALIVLACVLGLTLGL